jgi:hypothetical protein
VSTPEGRVLKAVCDYLALQERLGRCVFWRQNNGATFDHRRGVYRTPNGAGAKAGVPDVAVILNGGRFVAVECKSMSGRLSDGQKAIKSALEGVGAVYVVARGVRDIEPLFAPPLPSSRLQPHGD